MQRNDDKDEILQKLEEENKKLRDEFDIQRAKMKELYLQKEGECKKLNQNISSITKELLEAKSQVVIAAYKTENQIYTQERKAQEEIANLQHLLHETIQESSCLKADLNNLQCECEKIKAENFELKENYHQDTPSLAPVFNHVKKIARKFGGDASNQDNMEDSMWKAQEDAEVLRSLVVPLEEEIKALKEKLRATDDELQKHEKHHENTNEQQLEGIISTNTKQTQELDTTTCVDTSKMVVNSVISKPCEMCHNYETHLLQSQNSLREERQKILEAEKSIEHLKEELSKEAVLRMDLESQWQEKREIHKEEVQILNNAIKIIENNFAELHHNFNASKKELNEQLLRLTEEREQIHHHLFMLQRDNDILSGKYIAHSQALQNQEINLPNTVEELQEILLSTHENLIEAKIGCEHAESEMLTLKDESQLLRAQIREHNRESTNRVHYLEDILNNQKLELQKCGHLKLALEKKDIEFKKNASELREQVIELHEANDKLEKTNMDLKSKLSVLQQDLANSEAVQKDFVRLSQSLQMELEKIRAADTQLRWQDDDDVDQCISCKTLFTVTRRKQHCRHCGTIYCDKCLTKTVQSGSNKKTARVCDVCHTLLVRNTAPYFSQAPPQSP